MIDREIEEELKKAVTQYPIVALLGPRQSGKTTVLKKTFPHYKYVLLEDLDLLNFALSDPRGFLNQYSNEHGLIIDEAQNAPDLFSYLQGIVDQSNLPGKFILSGSQNFYLNEKISQSLAGRVCILTLLPLSLKEIKQAESLPEKYEEILFNGQYPLIYAKEMNPHQWYLNYIRTYIERDIRQLKNITDLHLFQKFIALCAGRNGQIVNWSQLAADCGISTKTVTSWISLLEASYLVFLLYPHHQNFNKRLVKSPKLYFFDSGVVCALLKITSAEQLETHYLKGAIFESFVISELAKANYNRGLCPELHFWCDQSKHEIDCIVEFDGKTIPIEIKSGRTINSKFFEGLNYWNSLSMQTPTESILVYGGEEVQRRSYGNVLGWKQIDSITSKSLVG